MVGHKMASLLLIVATLCIYGSGWMQCRVPSTIQSQIQKYFYKCKVFVYDGIVKEKFYDLQSEIIIQLLKSQKIFYTRKTSLIGEKEGSKWDEEKDLENERAEVFWRWQCLQVVQFIAIENFSCVEDREIKGVHCARVFNCQNYRDNTWRKVNRSEQVTLYLCITPVRAPLPRI